MTWENEEVIGKQRQGDQVFECQPGLHSVGSQPELHDEILSLKESVRKKNRRTQWRTRKGPGESGACLETHITLAVETVSFTYCLENNSRLLPCSQNVVALIAQAAQILECRMETGNMGKCYPCPRNWLWNFFTCSCSYYDIYPVCRTKFLQVSSGKMAVIWQMSKQKNKTRYVYTSHKSLKNALIHPTDGSENIHGRQMGFCMPKEFKPWKTIREESPKLPGEARVGRVTMMWSISRTIQTTARRGTSSSGTICTTNKSLKLPDLLVDPQSSMKSQWLDTEEGLICNRLVTTALCAMWRTCCLNWARWQSLATWHSTHLFLCHGLRRHQFCRSNI